MEVLTNKFWSISAIISPQIVQACTPQANIKSYNNHSTVDINVSINTKVQIKTVIARGLD